MHTFHIWGMFDDGDTQRPRGALRPRDCDTGGFNLSSCSRLAFSPPRRRSGLGVQSSDTRSSMITSLLYSYCIIYCIVYSLVPCYHTIPYGCVSKSAFAKASICGRAIFNHELEAVSRHEMAAYTHAIVVSLFASMPPTTREKTLCAAR